MKFLSTPMFVAAFAVSILSGGLARAGDESMIRQFWIGELSVEGESRPVCLSLYRREKGLLAVAEIESGSNGARADESLGLALLTRGGKSLSLRHRAAESEMPPWPGCVPPDRAGFLFEDADAKDLRAAVLFQDGKQALIRSLVEGEGESALLPLARVGYFAIDAHVAWARLQTSAASTVATIWVRGQEADAPLDADRIEVWIVARDGAATPLQSRPSGKSEFACLGCVADPEKQGPIVEASFTFAPGSDPAADRLVVVAVDGRPVVMDPASALKERQ